MTARSRTVVASAALVIVVLHVAVSWGQMPVYWGDSGRWLHEVDRFAGGERLYRDFYWPFPPLAMWIVGGLGRVFGSDLAQIWTITAIVAALIALAWVRYAARLCGDLTLPVVLIGLPLGITFASIGSAPLSTGMYTPAAPVGFLCLLVLLLFTIALGRQPSLASAAGVGVFGALCVLSKHDFWISAFLLVAAAPWLASDRRREVWLTSWGASALVLLPAGAFLVAQNGFSVLPGILGGYGIAREYGGRSSPTLETLVLELIATAGLLTLLLSITAIAVPRRRRLALAGTVVASSAAAVLATVWLLRTVTIAQLATGAGDTGRSELLSMLAGTEITLPALIRTSVRLLRDRLTLHAIPSLVPVIALAALVRWRHRVDGRELRLMIVLLVAAIALRARRGMEHSEWTSVLLELPLYVFLAGAIVSDLTESRRVIRWSLIALVPLILWQHYANGYGVLTRRGPRVAVDTPRGAVRLHPGQARHYQRLRAAVDSLDPSGRRALLSFGYSSSFNYFLRRPPATPLTHGFRIGTLKDPRDAVRIARSLNPPVIGIDNPFWAFGLPEIGLAIHRWERREKPGPYITFDRPLFEAVVAGCRRLEHVGLEGFTIYDCPAQVRPP
ncbi:MAG: hypothetical protein ACT4OZ_12850 [Gemmatimonadota bacterium]